MRGVGLRVLLNVDVATTGSVDVLVLAGGSDTVEVGVTGRQLVRLINGLNLELCFASE